MKNILILTFLIFSLLSCTSQKKEVPASANVPSSEGWARPAAQGGMSAAYFIYTNPLNMADTLSSLSSNVSMMTQFHESYMTDDGLAGMREMKNHVVESNEQLVLEPGGLHVMLMRLKNDLAEGDSVTIALSFAQAGEVVIIVPVKASN